MRLQHVTLALISLFVLILTAACGISIHAVDDTTPTTAPTASRAIMPTPTSQPASDPSPTTAEPTPSSTASAAATTTPMAVTTAAPTVTPSPTPRPTPPQAPPVSRPTVQSQPPSPTPTSIAPTPTPSPTPEPNAPACADMPVRGFGLLWTSNPTVARSVGCPLAPEVGLSARVQPYEHGTMIWLDTLTPGIDQAPWVITLTDDAAARYRVPANGPSWDEDVSEPTGAFKWVLDNVYTVHQSIGAALAPWYATDAALQRFDHGMMLWVKAPPDGGKPMIYVLSDDLLSASTTTYQSFVDQGAP